MADNPADALVYPVIPVSMSTNKKCTKNITDIINGVFVDIENTVDCMDIAIIRSTGADNVTLANVDSVPNHTSVVCPPASIDVADTNVTPAIVTNNANSEYISITPPNAQEFVVYTELFNIRDFADVIASIIVLTSNNIVKKFSLHVHSLFDIVG